MKRGTCVYCSGRRNVPWIIIWYTSLLVLLLAYMKGNANLCRAIVRAGARLGVNNNQGINIFNYQVATKQLLFRLLGIRSMRLTFTVELKPNVCWLTPQRLVYLECVHFHAFGYSKVIMLQIRFCFLSSCLMKICCPKSPPGATAPTVTNVLPSLESLQESITGMYLECLFSNTCTSWKLHLSL